MYRVVIAEDFKMVREVFENAVRQAEGYEMAASFGTAYEAVEYIKVNKADLVIMDVLIPGSMNGLEASAMIKEISPKTKIIIVTSMPEMTYIDKARKIGVDSFWYKEVQEQPIQEIITRTMNGESIYPIKKMKVKLGEAEPEEFTETEKTVLRELVAGKSNKEIAESMMIEENTVKWHIRNLITKTGYHTRLELALNARHLGLIISD